MVSFVVFVAAFIFRNGLKSFWRFNPPMWLDKFLTPTHPNYNMCMHAFLYPFMDHQGETSDTTHFRARIDRYYAELRIEKEARVAMREWRLFGN